MPYLAPTFAKNEKGTRYGTPALGAVAKNQVTDFAPWRITKSDLDSDRVQSLVRELKAKGHFPKGGLPYESAGLFDANT